MDFLSYLFIVKVFWFYYTILQEDSLCDIDSLNVIEVCFMAQYTVCFCNCSVCSFPKMYIFCLSYKILLYLYCLVLTVLLKSSVLKNLSLPCFFLRGHVKIFISCCSLRCDLIS